MRLEIDRLEAEGLTSEAPHGADLTDVALEGCPSRRESSRALRRIRARAPTKH